MINTVLNSYKRGDIVLVDFGETVGSEQGGIRPALIIQNNQGNQYSPTVIVTPLTSRDKKSSMPTHFSVVPDKNNNLRTSSVIIFEQIKTIDKQRILKKTGQVSNAMIQGINRALAISVGLSAS